MTCTQRSGGWAYTVLPNLLPEGTRAVSRPSLVSMGRGLSCPQGRKMNILNNNQIYPTEDRLSLLTSSYSALPFPGDSRATNCRNVSTAAEPSGTYRKARTRTEKQSRCSHQDADWRERLLTHHAWGPPALAIITWVSTLQAGTCGPELSSYPVWSM